MLKPRPAEVSRNTLASLERGSFSSELSTGQLTSVDPVGLWYKFSTRRYQLVSCIEYVFISHWILQGILQPAVCRH